MSVRAFSTVSRGSFSLSGVYFGTMLGMIFLAMVHSAFNMTGVNTCRQGVAIAVMLTTDVFLGEHFTRG